MVTGKKQDECSICHEEAVNELQCSSCKYYVHFKCVLGFAPPAGLESSTEKGKHICPPCLVGASNNLLHIAIDAHTSTPPSARELRAERRASFRGAESVNTVSVTVQNQAGSASPPAVKVNGDTPNTVDTGAPSEAGSTHPEHELSPLSPPDLARSGRPKYILKTLRNLPSHTDTLILGDSNSHHIDGKEIDPVNNSVAIRSSGGLCIVALVHALKEHTSPLNRLKKVYLAIGVNDFLHSDDHCLDDWPHHIKSLQTECLRVFPRAKLFFILPFRGLPSVPQSFLKELEHQLKTQAPKFKRLSSPFMRNKVDRGGVHINDKGKQHYLQFLQKVTGCTKVIEQARVDSSVGTVQEKVQKDSDVKTESSTDPGQQHNGPPATTEQQPSGPPTRMNPWAQQHGVPQSQMWPQGRPPNIQSPWPSSFGWDNRSFFPQHQNYQSMHPAQRSMFNVPPPSPHFYGQQGHLPGHDSVVREITDAVTQAMMQRYGQRQPSGCQY